MDHGLVPLLVGDHVCKITLIDLDIHAICRPKGHNLHVVPVGTSLGHLLQMALELTINFFGGWGSVIDGGRVASSILPLGIPSDATTRVDVNEAFVELGILTHVLDDARANFVMLGLGAKELIGESMKQAVP